MAVKPKIFVTQKIFPEITEELAQTLRLSLNNSYSPFSSKALIQKAKDADGLLSFLTDTLNAKVIESLPRVKIISNFAVGYNNIDVEAATRRGIYICNTPNVLTEATADLAWALILACARKIPEADRFTKTGKFKGWRHDLYLGSGVHGKVLGIIGFGRVGQAVARRAQGFAMKALYFNRSKYEGQREWGATDTDLETLLKQSDFVTVHTPLNKTTYHLIGTKELALMKPAAYLINTARGAIVDEKALLEALKKKKIAGAGLDVYENEPKIAPGLTKFSNVICLPHIGSATKDTRMKMAESAAQNLIEFFRGKTPPPNCVNPSLPK